MFFDKFSKSSLVKFLNFNNSSILEISKTSDKKDIFLLLIKSINLSSEISIKSSCFDSGNLFINSKNNFLLFSQNNKNASNKSFSFIFDNIDFLLSKEILSKFIFLKSIFCFKKASINHSLLYNSQQKD